MTLTDRQAYALAHPITSARPGDTDIGPYRLRAAQPDGNLLVTVLAIDR